MGNIFDVIAMLHESIIRLRWMWFVMRFIIIQSLGPPKATCTAVTTNVEGSNNDV